MEVKMNVLISRRNFLTSAAYAGAGMVTLSLIPGCSMPWLKKKAPKPLDELIDYDALGLAKLIKDKQVTPRELIEVVINRIETLEPTINALTTRCFERALNYADKVSLGSTFAGVPTLIKDMVDVAGVPRTDGSRMMLNNVPKESVKYIKALEKSGLIILGMTNVPEFTTTALTDNEVFGPCHNPWGLDYTTLGSSGGAAAAVAAGYVPLAHGTDGGGSNRLPPNVCGVFGVKPSRYRMLSGEADGSHDLFKTNQAISRSVRDSAALFNDTEDKSGKVFEPVGLITEPSKRRLRIAFAPNGVKGYPVQESIQAVQKETAKLCEELGHKVTLIEHPIDGEEFFYHYNNAFLTKFQPLIKAAEQISGKSARESGLLTPFTISMAEFSMKITAEEIDAGFAYFKKIGHVMADYHEKVDMILSPVMPIETPKIGYVSPTDNFLDKKFELEEMLSITANANAIGAPAMSVPLFASKKSRMPVGSMFQADVGQDRLLYELAFELEQAKPWKDKWAPHSVMYAASK
jgi:amidase